MKTLNVDQVLDSWTEPKQPGQSGIAIHKYIVTKVTNSVTPKINIYLTEDELVVYCESDEWAVTIK